MPDSRLHYEPMGGPNLMARTEMVRLRAMATMILLQPPEREALLVEVAGLPSHVYWDDAETTPITGTPVELRANPDNEVDRFAVEVWWNDHQMGHLPSDVARCLSEFLQDAGAVPAFCYHRGTGKAYSMRVLILGLAADIVKDARQWVEAHKAAQEVWGWRYDHPAPSFAEIVAGGDHWERNAYCEMLSRRARQRASALKAAFGAKDGEVCYQTTASYDRRQEYFVPLNEDYYSIF
ncbi:HIRAN domain-containing protein (plasmid) [Skermanella sp. TT6]|uniref:HIRAN domain-containing protein n=1 Tax=Skermanella cutis TaxID=2775420 RepID=A0ABX7BHH5_9PROT|nr:HIRAN domain-containing protein [Skermanella sp. TT6]QQP93534.1 HIRAN domain-containing protein [Skermanella sp. TT6]